MSFKLDQKREYLLETESAVSDQPSSAAVVTPCMSVDRYLIKGLVHPKTWREEVGIQITAQETREETEQRNRHSADQDSRHKGRKKTQLGSFLFYIWINK